MSHTHRHPAWLGASTVDPLCTRLDCGESNILGQVYSRESISIRTKWRASLVPAAAVIPAPLAYTIIVAVKRLVVGLNCIVRCDGMYYTRYTILLSLYGGVSGLPVRNDMI